MEHDHAVAGLYTEVPAREALMYMPVQALPAW